VLCTETTFNDTYDFRIGRGPNNFAYLRTLGQRINTRLLHLERSAHHCGLSHARLIALAAPSRITERQPAPALKIGDPCVTALLAALCLFVLAPEGITKRRLRPLVEFRDRGCDQLPPVCYAFKV
jgi:hypothetical protein